jgi:hypothetical protein
MGGVTAKSLQLIIGGREYRETTAAASLALMGNLAAFSQLQQSTEGNRDLLQPEALGAREGG